MSYNLLVNEGKLVTYREAFPNWFVEVWEHEGDYYECHWLPRNGTLFPTTINKL